MTSLKRVLAVFVLLAGATVWCDELSDAQMLLEQVRAKYQTLERTYEDALELYQGLRNEVTVRDARYSIGSLCQGRLTVVSGTPVPTTVQASPSTLYFTPYLGDKITVYNPVIGIWMIRKFTEVSLALTGLTSGKNYDVFFYVSAGTPTLELGTAWTSDTARAEALTTQNGIYVKSGAAYKRYLGTIRATGATTTTDTVLKRFVWNYYNRVPRALNVTEATNTWTYALAAWRQVNASTANQVEVVVGINEVLVQLVARGKTPDTTTDDFISIGIGLDSTTASSALFMGGECSADADFAIDALYWGYPGIGYHYFPWLESSPEAVSHTFEGDNNTPTYIQMGMIGTVEG